MDTLSVILLSFAINDDIYEMNCNAIDSLYRSERWKEGELDVVLVESCHLSHYQYDMWGGVSVVKPSEPFNFHRFFNIGMALAKGQWIAFCNNDILFVKGWWTAIKDVYAEHKDWLCFSPIDDHYPKMAALDKTKPYHLGWDYGKYMAQWCFVWNRRVFDIIGGGLDETFNFYAADADEEMTLRYWAIPNIAVTKSVVRHLASQTIGKVREDEHTKKLDPKQYPLTKEELRRGYQWLWDDIRWYDAWQKEKNKWGNLWTRRRLHRILDKYPFLQQRWITKIIYSKRGNVIINFLTGMKD